MLNHMRKLMTRQVSVCRGVGGIFITPIPENILTYREGYAELFKQILLQACQMAQNAAFSDA
jgi:hypothetical protein